MTDLIRLVLSDEYSIVRQGIRLILEQDPDIRVVGEASSTDEAIDLTRRKNPDVVIADIVDQNVISDIKEQDAHTRILILSQSREPALVSNLLRAGADAYLLKQSPSTDLLHTVRLLAAGRHSHPIVDPHIKLTNQHRGHLAIDHLSEREREILELVAAGQTSKLIAQKLYLSRRTVDNHRARIMAKLQVENCAQATSMALQLGLIHVPFQKPVAMAAP